MFFNLGGEGMKVATCPGGFPLDGFQSSKGAPTAPPPPSGGWSKSFFSGNIPGRKPRIQVENDLNHPQHRTPVTLFITKRGITHMSHPENVIVTLHD